MGLSLLIAVLGSSALAQSPNVPARQIPPSVLMELRLLENRFELALSTDCAPERCFSKGCTYLEHAVADQPGSTSLPGLGLDPGPGSVPAQEYLTRARCAFAYEKSIESKDVQALARRLQGKLSQAWTVVSVGHEALPPLPQYLLTEPPPEPDPVVEPEPEPEPEPVVPVVEEWTAAVALRELWTTLLPHFYWMIGLALTTFAAILLIWAWRRVGRASIEEQALLAQLAQPDEDEEPAAAEPVVEVPAIETPIDDPVYVASQSEVWNARLGANPNHPDLEIQALIRTLLRDRDMPLLAKAVLEFPETFPAAFPSGGEIASAKLELADYLKTVKTEDLPSDTAFFAALNRHALAATLATQADAEVVRSLREEFGAAGLVDVIDRLPARPGALLFALAPSSEQQELVRLLTPQQTARLAEQLLRSNRMDEAETAYLFEVLSAVRKGAPLPEPPDIEVSDRGPTHDATAALSVLLPNLNPTTRATLFKAALERFNGTLPAWYRGIFFADLLFQLPEEARIDLLLAVDVERLAAWYSLLDRDTQARLISGLPNSLRVSMEGANNFPSRARQLAVGELGRQSLAAGFQRQLARAGLAFDRALGATGGT